MIRVFWISLANSTRHKFMNCQMDKFAREMDFEHEWIPGMRSDRLVLEDNTGRRAGPKTGCLASHMKAVKSALDYMRRHSKGFAIIFEDDVDMSHAKLFWRLRPNIRQIVTSTPNDWDVIQLGYHTHWWKELRAKTTRIVTSKQKFRHAWSLLAYVISRKAAEDVVAGGHVNGTKVHVKCRCHEPSADGCLMNGNMVRRRWRAYIATPPIFWEPKLSQSPIFESHVGSNRQLRVSSRRASIRWNEDIYGKVYSDAHTECVHMEDRTNT